MELARLKLLCRRARALPAEVLRLVQAYLVLHVQWHCPLWVEMLLEDKIRAMPRCGSRSRSFRIVMATSARIEYADYRQDQVSLYDRGPLQAPEADQPVDVVVTMATKFKPWEHRCPRTRWELVCRQGIVCLRSASNGYSMWGGSRRPP